MSDKAQETLRDERRRRFFAEVLDPMLAEARVIGIPLADIVSRIQGGGGAR
ncbi:hypothetical protein [Fodinicola feengrottensis]|uniref:hypothetical protein n=1 Tax=Fodinicola feengrottensis TaxID=435914 RepID=UPI002442CDCD|nr:hypothetical protein [Fodinicola feengrottensis]